MPISSDMTARVTYVSREAFVRDHMVVCAAAAPARKYDRTKPAGAAHTLDYTRRKCAKNLWRRGFRALCHPGGDDRHLDDDADALIRAAIARGEAIPHSPSEQPT